MRRILLSLGLVCAFLLVGVSIASASTIYTLTTGNSPGLNGFPGPYGTAEITLVDSTHADVTFTSNTSGGPGFIYLFGDGSSVDVNVSGSFALTGTTTGSNSQTGFTPGPYTDGGSGTVDGWGTFNQRIDSFDGYTHSSTTITFHLLATGANTWASDAVVLAANADGHRIAAHIFPCAAVGTTGKCDAGTDTFTGQTGFATDGGGPGSGGQTGVPEPASLLLLGSGLAFVARRVHGKKDA